MKILIVCSYNRGRISPFISEQVESLNRLGLKTDYFLINDTGAFGYLKSLPKLKKKVKEYQPDIIHAHYGLSGLLSVLQCGIPVVITFHGSDINNKRLRLLSRIASRLSVANIFVSSKMMELMPAPYSYLIPCGVDLGFFKLINKDEARIELALQLDKKYILFSSGFDNTVKNYPLAISALEKINNTNIELIELMGYSRSEVVLLMNAVDVVLLTSYTEGSPQFIKEAMACNRPIVATDVGDIGWLFGNEYGHFIIKFDPNDLVDKLILAFDYAKKNKKTKGRDRIIFLGLNSENIARKIVDIYIHCLTPSEKSDG